MIYETDFENVKKKKMPVLTSFNNFFVSVFALLTLLFCFIFETGDVILFDT